MKTIETERLILRALRIDDCEHMFQYAKKPNIGPMAGWQPHQTIEDTIKILKLMVTEGEVWAITIKPSDVICGTIGLHVRNFMNAVEDRREIGYVLNDTYWGKGYTPEAVHAVIAYAFQEEDIKEIVCGHLVENEQSKRVIEKCGFVYTHEEERDHFDGTKVKVKMYKITRKMFMKEDYNDA